jgi:hypothetical protein
MSTLEANAQQTDRQQTRRPDGPGTLWFLWSAASQAGSDRSTPSCGSIILICGRARSRPAQNWKDAVRTSAFKSFE